MYIMNYGQYIKIITEWTVNMIIMKGNQQINSKNLTEEAFSDSKWSKGIAFENNMQKSA